MEGAGASIVSQADETPGMDSPDEQPELPSTVQDLIQRLEGKGERLRGLPRLSGKEFRDFFPQPLESNSDLRITGWRGQVRRRVLEAIGNCNTFEYLHLSPATLYGGLISMYTASEWEEVLGGFRSNTVLHEIKVEALEWYLEEELESLCLQIGSILNSSSVEILTIRCPLSARCFLNLASGLRGNSDPKLRSLYLEYVDSSAVKHMVDMIKFATRLETLSLGSIDDVEEETVGILSQALMQSLSLKELTLRSLEWGGPLLLKALAGDDRNRSIERLLLHGLSMSPEEWHQLGEIIRDKAIATTYVEFGVIDGISVRDNWESIEALASAASSGVQEPTVELVLSTLSDHELMLSLNLLGRVLNGEIKSLKSFSIEARNEFSLSTIQDRPESILPMNGNTGEISVLKRLQLNTARYYDRIDLCKVLWKDLFWCLRGNTSLTHLHLSYSKLHEEAFRDLMGLLQVNLTLQEIDVSKTSWATDGKAALIEEALKQNQKRAVYMSVFREAKLTFGDAKAGRLFLCGSPRAGKTKLRQTLIRIVQGKSWLGNKLDQLWRTKGIEVEFLQNNDQGQISIWDLAGQEIFRTLQNVLLPQTINFCVFLFVYSLFCEKTSSDKPKSCFQTELEEWLSFITSGTRFTGHIRPQVLVVISHKDKVKSSSLTWAHSVMDELIKKFAKFVDLHPMQECFQVDARSRKQVSPLKDHIFDIFKKLLSEKSPLVPHLCSELSSLLVTNTKYNRSCPLLSFQEFDKFCSPSLTKFVPSSSAINHSRIMTSIISYLNDVGSIVYIPNLNYIIVDPNWLTNTLLGELVALGQNFHAEESGSSDKTLSLDSYTSKDGFVSESDFARLIEEFMQKQSHGEEVVGREVLENILINLDLCFKLEDSSQYFIPSFIPEHASMEESKHQERARVESMAWKTQGKTSQFVGIRIQCQDQRTMSLTAAFFPCFEMFMRRKLISKMHVSKEMVTCSRHYLQIFLDGHQIYVQQGKSYKYVDVLMLCSKHKSREGALKYIMKHIVQELISFCASSKGCPGTALVLGVIQTLCVEMMIPSDLRGTILIEELKSKFVSSINDKLEDLPLDKSHWEKEEELLNYEHSWPLIEGYIAQVIFERARDLLLESDVEAVVNEMRKKRMQQFDSLQQALIQQLESLQQGLIKVNNDLIDSYPENQIVVTNSNFSDMKDSNRPSSKCLSRARSSVENHSTRLLLFEFHQLGQKIDQIGQKVDDLDERLRSVESIVQRMDIKLGQILYLQQELQSTLSSFMSKVDSFIQYSHSFQQARTPKRPYITNDVGIFYSISALLHVGTTVCLHLMCESTTGFHPVKDQEGLKIRLDRTNCKWIRKTIEISFKVMYYAAKAGLDATLGLGQAIPEWGDLKSDVVKLDGISDRDRRAVLKGGESNELEEAWLRIQQTLASINYSEIFKLYQVKYVRLELGGHAWVCEECMNKGISSGILTH